MPIGWVATSGPSNPNWGSLTPVTVASGDSTLLDGVDFDLTVRSDYAAFFVQSDRPVIIQTALLKEP